jgi:hypothetical protein
MDRLAQAQAKAKVPSGQRRRLGEAPNFSDVDLFLFDGGIGRLLDRSPPTPPPSSTAGGTPRLC